MIVDIHTHPFGNPKIDLSDKIKSRRDAVLLRFTHPEAFREIWGNPQDMTENLLADMNARGIDKAILQPPVGEDPRLVAERVRKHPDRFVGLFKIGGDKFFGGPGTSSAKPDMGKLAEEIDFQVRELGLKGLGEFALSYFTKESAPDRIAKDLFPLMEILSKYRVPVMLLTAWTQFGNPLYHGLPLFVDDIAERYPEVPIILMKMGRGYDFIFEMSLAVAYKHINVYFETSQAPAAHIRKAVAELGAERVMFGTDWTHTWRSVQVPTDIYTRSLGIIDEAGLSGEDREWVLGKTAAKLFKL